MCVLYGVLVSKLKSDCWLETFFYRVTVKNAGKTREKTRGKRGKKRGGKGKGSCLV